MLWPKFISELSVLAKGANITTAIETCGQFPYENYESIKDNIDYILFDLKIMDPESHKKYCGHSNQQILENFCNIASTRNDIVRIPIIPSINDTPENLLHICQFLEPFRNHISAIHLLPYHNMATNKYDALQRQYTLPDIIPPSNEQMEQLRQYFTQAGFRTQIGG